MIKFTALLFLAMVGATSGMKPDTSGGCTTAGKTCTLSVAGVSTSGTCTSSLAGMVCVPGTGTTTGGGATGGKCDIAACVTKEYPTLLVPPVSTGDSAAKCTAADNIVKKCIPDPDCCAAAKALGEVGVKTATALVMQFAGDTCNIAVPCGLDQGGGATGGGATGGGAMGDCKAASESCSSMGGLPGKCVANPVAAMGGGAFICQPTGTPGIPDGSALPGSCGKAGEPCDIVPGVTKKDGTCQAMSGAGLPGMPTDMIPTGMGDFTVCLPAGGVPAIPGAGDLMSCVALTTADTCNANPKCKYSKIELPGFPGMSACGPKDLVDKPQKDIDMLGKSVCAMKKAKADCDTDTKCEFIDFVGECVSKDLAGFAKGVAGDLGVCAPLPDATTCNGNSKCGFISTLGACVPKAEADQANNAAAMFGAFEKCAMIMDKDACNGDATCDFLGDPSGATDFGVCVTMAEATAAKTAFGAGSSALKGLGSDLGGAVKGLMGDAATMADKVKSMTPKDMDAIISVVSGEMAKGKGIAQKAKEDMMAKIKGDKASGGWGDVSQWTVDNLAEAGDLLSGLPLGDLENIGKDAFVGAVKAFGKCEEWGKDQATKLAKKFKESVPDIAKVTGAKLKEVEGFLNGFDPSDIRKIPATAFNDAQDAFKKVADKIGAFTDAQEAELGNQVKDFLNGLVTPAKVEQLGSLVGTLPTTDLKAFADDAIAKLSDKAAKIMGGAKAAEAFSADKLDKLTDMAKKAFNGADLEALAKASLDKLKAVIPGCPAKCPGAIADITVYHDDAVEKAADILNKTKAALTKAGLNPADATLVQADFAWTPATATRRRRQRRLQRRLSGTAGGDTQSVVRIESSTSAGASSAGDVAVGATSGTKTVVNVAAKPQTVKVVDAGAQVGPAGLGLAFVLALAARLF